MVAVSLSLIVHLDVPPVFGGAPICLLKAKVAYFVK